MKRALCLIIAALFFVITISAQMKTSWQGKSSSLEKEKRAELLVDRAMRKFSQTLNFKNVFQEMFIKDRSARRREDMPGLEGLIDKEFLKTLDDATLERAYVKSQNLYWLFMIYALQEDDSDVSEIERGIVSKLNERQRVFYKRMMSENESSSAKTRAELNDCLTIYDTMSAALRKKITLQFRQNVRNNLMVTGKSVTPAKAAAYLSKYDNAFYVTLKVNDERTPFIFTVVEKSGVVKILSVAIDD